MLGGVKIYLDPVINNGSPEESPNVMIVPVPCVLVEVAIVVFI